MTIRVPRTFLLVLVAALALAGTGVSAFVLGRDDGRNSVMRPPPRIEFNAGYNAGRRAGYQTGFAEGNRTGVSAADSHGRHVGYNDGFSAGRQAGYTDGYNAAVKTANGRLASAVDEALAHGANSVFSGLPAFNIGSYYIVKIGAGQYVGHGYSSDYGLQSSLELQPGQSYNICTNSNGICGGRLPGT